MESSLKIYNNEDYYNYDFSNECIVSHNQYFFNECGALIDARINYFLTHSRVRGFKNSGFHSNLKIFHKFEKQGNKFFEV